jgi:acetyl-CoA carboxylase carboxyl transferase subunit alpha
MPTYLEFEKPIAELEGKIEELRHLDTSGDINIAEEVSKLQAKADRLLIQTYGKLTPWDKVQVARQGRFRRRSVMVIGNEKGSDTESRVRRNFGMARPEGYRKARRLMLLADHFQLPVITLVDTAGAYPGVGAEERGQAEAIARSIEACLTLRVPIVSAIVGEGGSGGAIALAGADRILMLEHAVYSVISPEGCASILWRSGDAAQQAAEALRLTAQDLLKMKVIDRIVDEPAGGAHRHRNAAMDALGDAIAGALDEVIGVDGGTLRARRREKFLEMGKTPLD